MNYSSGLTVLGVGIGVFIVAWWLDIGQEWVDDFWWKFKNRKKKK